MEQSKTLNHQLVEASAQLEFRQAARDEEARRVDTESAALEAASAALSAQEEQHASLESSFADFKTAYDAQSTAVSEQESLLQSLLTGMASGQHETQGGFQGQLAKAREKATAAKSEVQQAQVQIDHIERELRVKEPQAKHEAQESRALYKKLANVQQAAQEAELSLIHI